MKPLPALLILCTILLSGCGGNHQAENIDTPAAADSAYTGLPPSYPRALPVQTPPAPAQVAVAAPPPLAPEQHPAPQLSLGTLPTVTAPPPPAPEQPPSEPMPENPPPVTPSLPTPALPPDQTPAPASTMETTPPSPPVATAPPRPMDENDAKQEVVVLQTSLGNLVIQLNDVAAPRTCGNFRKLVSTGFYNHTIFHRVIPHFMIQGGDPNSRGDDRRTYGLGDPGYTLPAEIGLKNVTGAVAMARLPDARNPRRDSNGSQFYICVADCPTLDGQYTVFGHVIRGLDTALKIANAPRDNHDDPVDRIEMQATLETKQQALAENPQ